MNGYIRKLKDTSGNYIYPITVEDCIYMNDESTKLSTKLDNIDSELDDITQDLENRKPLYKQKYRGFNHLLGDPGFSISDASITATTSLLSEVGAKHILATFYINVTNADFTFTPCIDLAQFEKALQTAYNAGITTKAIKIHFYTSGATGIDRNNPPTSFFTNLKALVASYMNVAKNYGADTVFACNEYPYFTATTTPQATRDKLKDYITYIKNLGYKSTISFTVGEISKADKTIVDMLDYIGINSYPYISSNGLNISKRDALYNYSQNTIVKFAFNNPDKEFWLTETGCWDVPKALANPEKWDWNSDGNVSAEDKVTQGGAIRSYYYDTALEWIEEYAPTNITGTFFWATNTIEWRPTEDLTKNVIKKYWKKEVI